MAGNYLLGIVSNAFTTVDMVGKINHGKVTPQDLLNYTVGLKSTLASAGILVAGGVTAVGSSPFIMLALGVAAAGVLINAGATDDIMNAATNFLSDPAVVDSVHKSFENAGSFDVTYAAELNITPEVINKINETLSI